MKGLGQGKMLDGGGFVAHYIKCSIHNSSNRVVNTN